MARPSVGHIINICEMNECVLHLAYENININSFPELKVRQVDEK